MHVIRRGNGGGGEDKPKAGKYCGIYLGPERLKKGGVCMDPQTTFIDVDCRRT